MSEYEATMASGADRVLLQIEEMRNDRKEVKAEIKEAKGTEKEKFLQEELIALDKQLDSLCNAFNKLVAVAGMPQCESNLMGSTRAVALINW